MTYLGSISVSFEGPFCPSALVTQSSLSLALTYNRSIWGLSTSSALTYGQSISCQWDILSDSALMNDQSICFQLSSCENIYLFLAQLGQIEYAYVTENVFSLLGMRIYPVLSYVLSIIGSILELLSRFVILDSDLTLTWFTSPSRDRNTFKLIQLFMCRNLYVKHDFIAALKNLIKFNPLSFFNWTQLMLCYSHVFLSLIFIVAKLFLKTKKKARSHQLYRFHLSRRSSLITGILQHQAKNIKYTKTTCEQLNKQIHSGGYSTPIFEFDFLQPYITSDGSNFSTTAHFRYIDHVDDVKLLNYPPDMYIHTKIPLHVLCKMLPITKARKIASIHGLSVGSRYGVARLLEITTRHSCLECAKYFCVFTANKNSAQLNVDRVIKSRKKQASMSQSQKHSNNIDEQINPRDKKSHDSHQASSEFPPDIVDQNISYTIISNACKKMNKANIEEAGCSVCGELKPLRNLSRVKNIKNMLHILTTPGVTRIERKKCKSPLREYQGPVLDYTCSQVCDHCRSSIRNGKVPRLALANNLWLGKVPEELKSLRFVEKLLIARVRHTCSYVKVASGMRKMKANIIAFESPVPKIYDTLPPPRDDMDDVLAILFTGPCKPTPDDLKRTPFLVRRNHVAKALEWLKLNHCDYADIEISSNNLDQYDENSSPVSIEYRESNTNKVAEGSSVFDKEVEDGTEEGECSFSVHGLTGEALETMTTNAIKAHALHHLNSGGKMLAVGHSDKFESIWNNPQLYPQMFPWLFPYGLGGIGTTDLSDKEHIRHLLMYHDKRFQVDINFPFVAFSHAQTKTSTTQSFLLADQHRFGDIANRLLNVDQNVLANMTKKLAEGEYIKPETEAEKACFQVIHDLDHVSGQMHGSTTSKKFMRNEIWSLINFIGAPHWYITLSPADTKHPICIYYADTKEEFKPEIMPYDKRTRLVCQNPVAGARFFHFMVEIFISDVLGVDTKHCGLYGDTNGYYGTVEQQGRLTLHLHMLIWIKGSLNPQEMREKIMSSSSEWQKKLIDWLENCHTGDFLTGTHAEVSKNITENAKTDGYSDPTETMPESPPPKCKKTVHSENEDFCKACKNLDTW